MRRSLELEALREYGSEVRAIFFGTPQLAVPALRALAESQSVVGVVCQPDRPAGRGLSLSAPAVKQAALHMGIEVHQPVKVKTGNLDEWIRNRDADVVVVMAYGRILPPAVLSAPRLGCVNLHASLLPRYRGAAPIQWAIIRGEAETGVSLMQMDEGLDTGPVYAMRRLPIGDKEDAGSLADRIAELSAVVVREDLPRVLRGELVASSQDDAQATFAPPITAEMTVVDFTSPPRDIVNLVRGLSPRPGAQTRLRGRLFKVLAATVASGSSDAPAGTVVFADRRGAAVSAGGGLVRIVRGQLEGRKALEAQELINGRVLRVGDRLGEAAGEA